LRILSGIQPSGDFHLGNYFGMIAQMVAAQEKGEVFAFIANYHAMTSVFDGAKLRSQTIEAARAFLSLGIDCDRSIFWLQSAIPEVLELYWVLSQQTPIGLLERAHSFKDKTARGLAASHGLFSYPVLMAADILLYDSDVVPVGKDQIQHVEIARDIAVKFNNEFGADLLKLPTFSVPESVAVVPGLDGAKMSKSYKNTIEIFLDRKALEKKVKQIVTQPVALEEPKEWRGDFVYDLCALFLDEDGKAALQKRYEKGGEGHGRFKAYLTDLIWDFFAPARAKYADLTDEKVLAILELGAAKARKIAAEKMRLIRSKVGII
jgi:tryptophanyl-tRNA synthetase